MWFSLKHDYETRTDEIHRESWDITKIKKGATIDVRLDFFFPAWPPAKEDEVEVTASFIFSSGGLKGLTLEDLELPKQCSMDDMANIFCPTQRKFFFAGHYNNQPHITKQICFCPICGKKVSSLPPRPVHWKEEIFVERKP